MVLNEVKRICQGCGREFSITQSELDEALNRNISLPVFCSNSCALHGWDPQAVWLGQWRRSKDTDEG